MPVLVSMSYAREDWLLGCRLWINYLILKVCKDKWQWAVLCLLSTEVTMRMAHSLGLL